jgi:hypothetical protein
MNIFKIRNASSLFWVPRRLSPTLPHIQGQFTPVHVFEISLSHMLFICPFYCKFSHTFSSFRTFQQIFNRVSCHPIRGYIPHQFLSYLSVHPTIVFKTRNYRAPDYIMFSILLLHPLFIFLIPKPLLRTLFSITLKTNSSLQVRDQVIRLLKQ